MTDEEFAQQVFAVPINGVPAGVLLQALLVYVNELHAVDGLDSATPLSITQTLRSVGTIVQTITEAEDGAITYERT
jgi:hypothetical protein